MKIDVLNIDGGKTGRQIDLPDAIFDKESNDHVIYLTVKQYLANQRQGTHATKERADIKGSTRKIKKQKGTGTARAGSIKNPLFRGGGRVFGPRPRNYGIKINKKVSRLARCVALSDKARAGKIIVVENFTFDAPRTRDFANVMTNLEVINDKPLLVLPEHDKTVYLSGRNLPKSEIRRANDLCVYDIINAGTLVMAEGSIDKISEQLA
jgi:large subunit ribosomal protein L4